MLRPRAVTRLLNGGTFDEADCGVLIARSAPARCAMTPSQPAGPTAFLSPSTDDPWRNVSHAFGLA